MHTTKSECCYTVTISCRLKFQHLEPSELERCKYLKHAQQLTSCSSGENAGSAYD
jgi:hypothetical protein